MTHRKGFIAAPEAASRRAFIDLERRLTALDEALDAIEASLVTIEADDYTPTLSGFSVGSGGSAANSAGYTYIGNATDGMLHIDGRQVFGTSGATFPGNPITVALPDGFECHPNGDGRAILGWVSYEDASATTYIGEVRRNSTTTLRLVLLNVSGTYPNTAGTSTTTPFIWVAGDALNWHVSLRVIRSTDQILAETSDALDAEDGTNLTTE